MPMEAVKMIVRGAASICDQRGALGRRAYRVQSLWDKHPVPHVDRTEDTPNIIVQPTARFLCTSGFQSLEKSGPAPPASPTVHPSNEKHDIMSNKKEHRNGTCIFSGGRKKRMNTKKTIHIQKPMKSFLARCEDSEKRLSRSPVMKPGIIDPIRALTA